MIFETGTNCLIKYSLITYFYKDEGIWNCVGIASPISAYKYCTQWYNGVFHSLTIPTHKFLGTSIVLDDVSTYSKNKMSLSFIFRIQV